MSFGGGKKPGLSGLFGNESATSYDVYLNLTPLMDVMSNILFFLLAAFGATVVAILPTTVPVRSTDTAAAVAEEEKVNVTIKAEALLLTVGCDSPNIDPAKLRELAGKIGKKDGTYDFGALNLLVRRIKESYPASKTVILVPEDDMAYEVIVKIMDAVRDYRLPDGRKIELFPEVVLSALVTGRK
jgi:biopolymer transport protein ExbD